MKELMLEKINREAAKKSELLFGEFVQYKYLWEGKNYLKIQ